MCNHTQQTNPKVSDSWVYLSTCRRLCLRWPWLPLPPRDRFCFLVQKVSTRSLYIKKTGRARKAEARNQTNSFVASDFVISCR
uniref:Uncharacterized protein n=1 Tax=Arundo donax TaxID=35708 RepID=A0A0A9D3V8_ARUDO